MEIPTWISQRQLGGSGPDTFIRVKLRDGSPRAVHLSFTSDRHQNEVQQKHLRSVDVDRLATDLLAYWIIGQFTEPEASRGEYERAELVAIKFLENQRLPYEHRVITDDFLKEVAEVYRKNISSAAVTWMESKVHIKAVADLLGHSSIAITGDIYGHTSDDTARAAVAGLADQLGLPD